MIAVNSIKENKGLRSLFWIVGYMLIATVFLYLENKIVFPVLFEKLDPEAPADIVAMVLESIQRSKWMVYLEKPLEIMVRIVAVSVCFYVVQMVKSPAGKKEFSTCWMVSVKSMLVFILFYAAMSTVDIVTLEQHSQSLFESMSLLHWFDAAALKETQTWLYILLLSVNLQEILYMLFLGFLVHRNFKYSFMESITFVLKTYGVMMLLFVAVSTIIAF